MLTLTQLAGCGAGGTNTVTPQPIDFSDVVDAGVTASAGTNVVTIQGVDLAITLRLTLTSQMSSLQVLHVYRNGTEIASGTSGTTMDVVVSNGQSLQYFFTNAEDNSLWSGTGTVTNLSYGGATLDTFSYSLQDTGTGGGGGGWSGGGGGGGEWNPP